MIDIGRQRAAGHQAQVFGITLPHGFRSGSSLLSLSSPCPVVLFLFPAKLGTHRLSRLPTPRFNVFIWSVNHHRKTSILFSAVDRNSVDCVI